MDNIYFCSFASTDMSKALKRIGRQAHNMKLFKNIFLYDENNLSHYGKENCNQIISKTGTRRGYAYWSWKPVIIKEVLSKLNESDILIYSDAGTHLNPSGGGKLLEYIKLAEEHDIWVVELENKHIEKKWAKRDTIDYIRDNYISKNMLSSYNEALNKSQLEGGTIILKKNDYTINLINQWYELMNIKNCHYFDDSPSISPNYEEFIENRHDQAILSLLLKGNHYISTGTEHFWASNKQGWKILKKSEPFLRLRDKGIKTKRDRLLIFNLPKRIIKKLIQRTN